MVEPARDLLFAVEREVGVEVVELVEVAQRLGLLGVEHGHRARAALLLPPLLQPRRGRQQHVGQQGHQLGHVDRHVRLLLHEDGQRTQVVVVRVRDDNVVELLIAEHLERRDGGVAVLVRVHPGVEHDARPSEVEVVAGGGDVGGVAEGEVSHKVDS